jgi:uncharacterized membrane protein YoaK (UPF0700 family)
VLKRPQSSERVNALHARAVQALLVVLSVTAGCTDVIGFLGLNGLFTAHITGNLVILAAHLATGDKATIAHVLAVPVFAIVVSTATVLAGGLEAKGWAALRPLLWLQALLLAGALAVCVLAGPRLQPNATEGILAGMLSVSAMAVQHALVQISIEGAPATAVMTSNVTRFAIAVGEVLIRRDPAIVSTARTRAARTWPAIAGFAIGCGIGAGCEAVLGMRSLILPAGLALIACAMGGALESDRAPTNAH